jgi:GTP-binding protein
LVHLIDVSPYSGRDPVEDYRIVMEELAAYNPDLVKRPQVVAANKIDLRGENKERLDAVKKLAARKKLPFLAISAMKEVGLKQLVAAMSKALASVEEAKK